MFPLRREWKHCSNKGWKLTKVFNSCWVLIYGLTMWMWFLSHSSTGQSQPMSSSPCPANLTTPPTHSYTITHDLSSLTFTHFTPMHSRFSSPLRHSWGLALNNDPHWTSNTFAQCSFLLFFHTQSLTCYDLFPVGFMVLLQLSPNTWVDE